MLIEVYNEYKSIQETCRVACGKRWDYLSDMVKEQESKTRFKKGWHIWLDGFFLFLKYLMSELVAAHSL